MTYFFGHALLFRLIMKKLPILSELLLYKNPTVIKRFRANYPHQAEEAELLFEQVLKYLWLCTKHEQELSESPNASHLQFLPMMHQEMRNIDHMWHELILLTVDYQAFCEKYFGCFIHHIPDLADKIEYSEESFTQELQLFLSYVYEQLGEETLVSWFGEHLNEPNEEPIRLD
jgi:hypothetical protein